ncbi:MAG: hypothetical protein ACFFCW_04565 [Candidatus Hodarchaeota archaeon]
MASVRDAVVDEGAPQASDLGSANDNDDGIALCGLPEDCVVVIKSCSCLQG